MARKAPTTPQPTSRITSVTFRSNIQIKDFQHVHVEASAVVGPQDNPSEVLDGVKVFVANELRRAREGKKEAVVRGGKFLDVLDSVGSFGQIR